jgi:hypothetical protein
MKELRFKASDGLWRVAFAFDRKRQARKLTQEEVAKRLNIRQDAVSRMERRNDIHLSTLNQGYFIPNKSLSVLKLKPAWR